MDILLDAKIDDLNIILNGMKDFLNKKTIDEIKEDINSAQHSSGSRKKLISYLKPILYNNKDLIIRTRKLINDQKNYVNNSDVIDFELDSNDLNDSSDSSYEEIKSTKSKKKKY